MAAPESVDQGENHDFHFSLEGTGLSGFVYTLEAKQYPGDTASISRTVTADSNNVVKVTVTPAETASLDVGLWYLTLRSVDTDETINESKRIQITKAWI